MRLKIKFFNIRVYYIMPYRKLKRNYRKKRTAKRYANISSGPTPNSLVRKLRYIDSISINPTTGGTSSYVFSANGINDPDITGVGHQPTGFDQYMLMYDHYKVLSSKITVTAAPILTGEASYDTTICAIYLDDDATSITDIRLPIENGLTSYKLLSAGNTHAPVRISKTFNHKTFFKNKKHGDNIVGVSTSNPSEQAYFNILLSCIDAVTNPNTVHFFVQVDYVVQFSERKTLALS